MKYDYADNQTKLIDPSAGTIEYTSYDAFGQLTGQKNARNQTTSISYKNDGRINQKVTPEGTTFYQYNARKQLCRIKSPSGVNKIYRYDTKGRLASVRDSIGSLIDSTVYTYNSLGQLSTILHPSGVIETRYYIYGYFLKVDAGGSTRYTVTSMNARQQLTGVKYGSNLNETRGYNSYGYLTSLSTGTSGSVRNYQYDFNSATGNMNWRKNVNQSNIMENFEYDNLDRLDRVYFGMVTKLDMAYTTNKGGISTKTDVGTLNYNSATKPYTLTSINPSTGLITSAMNNTLTYTSFESVNTISEGAYSATFTYNPENQRAKMIVQQNSSTILTRWYMGNSYTKEDAAGVFKEFTYIGGDAYTAPVLGVTQSGSTTYYYILRDHLGSITHIVNTSNSIVAEYSYDAWGRMRDKTTWVPYGPGSEPALFSGRGYTGHEHLPWFKMINMNGRVYDPLTGQFLSPDNYLQAPDFTQSLNRYGYCLNNPLIYTDPSGEFFWMPVIIGAIIGATTGAIMADQAGAQGFWEWAGYVGGGAVIGGLSGAAGAGISAAGGGAMLAGAGAGAIGGAGFSGLATGWDGSAMLTGAVNGALAGFVGGGVGSAIGGGWGALAGGAASNLTSQLLYNDGDFSEVNWASVGISSAASFGLYHGMQYMQYRAMDGKLGQLNVTYSQFSKINAAYQRSSFWHKEHGVILSRDGSARFVPRADRHKYDVTLRLNPRNGDFATVHTHWTRDLVDLGGGVFTVGGYHSPHDLASIPGYSLVVGRTSSTYSIGGTGAFNYINPDPFIRFFMFPWNW